MSKTLTYYTHIIYYINVFIAFQPYIGEENKMHKNVQVLTVERIISEYGDGPKKK